MSAVPRPPPRTRVLGALGVLCRPGVLFLSRLSFPLCLRFFSLSLSLSLSLFSSCYLSSSFVCFVCVIVPRSLFLFCCACVSISVLLYFSVFILVVSLCVLQLPTSLFLLVSLCLSLSLSLSSNCLIPFCMFLVFLICLVLRSLLLFFSVRYFSLHLAVLLFLSLFVLCLSPCAFFVPSLLPSLFSVFRYVVMVFRVFFRFFYLICYFVFFLAFVLSFFLFFLPAICMSLFLSLFLSSVLPSFLLLSLSLSLYRSFSSLSLSVRLFVCFACSFCLSVPECLPMNCIWLLVSFSYSIRIAGRFKTPAEHRVPIVNTRALFTPMSFLFVRPCIICLHMDLSSYMHTERGTDSSTKRLNM